MHSSWRCRIRTASGRVAPTFRRTSTSHGPEASEGEGQPWTATTWSLNTLREWGLDAIRSRRNGREARGEQPVGLQRRPVLAGRGRLLHQRVHARRTARGSERMSRAASHWFLEHRMGGRRLELRVGRGLDALILPLDAELARRAFSTTKRRRVARPSSAKPVTRPRISARAPADVSLSAGEPHAPWATHFAYPFRWFYSVLKALDYFRAAASDPTAPHRMRGSPRRSKWSALPATPDGTWLQERVHPGRVWFEVDVPAGEPSQWLTFYCARVHSTGGTPHTSARRARPGASAHALRPREYASDITACEDGSTASLRKESP